MISEGHLAQLVCLLSGAYCGLTDPFEGRLKGSDRDLNAARDGQLSDLAVKVAVSLSDSVDHFVHDGDRDRGLLRPAAGEPRDVQLHLRHRGEAVRDRPHLKIRLPDHL